MENKGESRYIPLIKMLVQPDLDLIIIDAILNYFKNILDYAFINNHFDIVERFKEADFESVLEPLLTHPNEMIKNLANNIHSNHFGVKQLVDYDLEDFDYAI